MITNSYPNVSSRWWLIAIAVLAAALLLVALPAGQASAQQCLPQGLNCTANDLDIHNYVVLPSSPDPVCDSVNDTITVDLQAEAQPNASFRYDIVTMIATDGNPVPGNDNCAAQVWQPIEDDGNPFNGTSGVGPYRDDDGDTCGDIKSTDGVTVFNLPRMTLPCSDPDGDNVVEIPGCFGWTQSAQGGQAITCNSVDDMIAEFSAGTAAKCWCGSIDIGIVVEPPAAVTLSGLEAGGSDQNNLSVWAIAGLMGIVLAVALLRRKGEDVA